MGDVPQLHELPANVGALFQVASQFNALEMTGPSLTPEDGVTRYETDHTQGPVARSRLVRRRSTETISAGSGPSRPDSGSPNRWIGCFGEALSKALNKPVTDLWRMRNGYALCTPAGLGAISQYLTSLSPEEVDALRGKLAIAMHSDVEVTDGAGTPGPLVSQAFCSALPISYADVPFPGKWSGFAALVLEAAYEATMWASVLNARRYGSNVVLLTLLATAHSGTTSAGSRRYATRAGDRFDVRNRRQDRELRRAIGGAS